MAKGQAFIVSCCLIGSWVAVRVMMQTGGSHPKISPSLPHNASIAVKDKADVSVGAPLAIERAEILDGLQRAELREIRGGYVLLVPAREPSANALSQPQRNRPARQTAAVDLTQDQPSLFLPNTTGPSWPTTSNRQSGISAPSGKILPLQTYDPAPAQSAPPKRLSLYGYAFWRQGGANSLAPRGQYGGSQIGLIAAYRLADSETAPAVTARFNIDADSFDQPEAALGLRWSPAKRIPVSLTVERRFRKGPNDSVAAFFAGGFGPVAVPLKVKLNGYAQAGFDLKDSATGFENKLKHFYDANLRAERTVADVRRVKLSVGGGVWAGGQTGINRLDVGPGAAIDFSAANSNFRLSADYRFRVAGNAIPGNGPALTLTASR